MFEEFLRWLASPSTDPADREHRVQVAAVALLQELAASDHEFKQLERARIVRSLEEDFGYSTELVEQLMVEAEAERADGRALYRLASMVRDHMSPDEKIKVVTAMWKLVLVDGTLDQGEERLLRSFSSLLQIDEKHMQKAHDEAAATADRLDVEDEPC